MRSDKIISSAVCCLMSTLPASASTTIPNNITIPKMINRKEGRKNLETTAEFVEKVWYQSTISYVKKESIVKRKNIDEILKESFKKSEYNWRTLEGVSKEINVSQKMIKEKLLEMAKQNIIFIGQKKATGEKIYSLIENYEKKTSFLLKIGDSIRGRVIR